MSTELTTNQDDGRIERMHQAYTGKVNALVAGGRDGLAYELAEAYRKESAGEGATGRSPEAGEGLSVRPSPDRRWRDGHPLPQCRRGIYGACSWRDYPTAFGQVFLIQSAAAVDSLWLVPGFGQPIGAVMLRIGIVMMRFGSQAANSYCGRFLLNPVTASL